MPRARARGGSHWHRGSKKRRGLPSTERQAGSGADARRIIDKEVARAANRVVGIADRTRRHARGWFQRWSAAQAAIAKAAAITRAIAVGTVAGEAAAPAGARVREAEERAFMPPVREAGVGVMGEG